MIELQGVSVSLHRHQILRDVTLSVGAEEVLAIVGPSGSGKSTLLRVVLGFIAPSGGSVCIKGMRVSADRRIVVPPEERHLAMVFQDLALWSESRWHSCSTSLFRTSMSCSGRS